MAEGRKPMGQIQSDAKDRLEKKYPTLGVCGLDCGLCPRYYTQGLSRCPGCAGPGFFDKHPSCGFITCCVKKKGLEVCAECSDFPCDRFKTEAEYQQVKESSSYPSYRVVMWNLDTIKKDGLAGFVDQQKKRIRLLEKMIADFDDGRSRSFFCKAVCLRDLTSLEIALNETMRRVKVENIRQDDAKAKARILRELLA
jgi:hypothetical protein